MSRPPISVVLPVWNEGENITACLRGLWKALASHEHEILVCYDLDEDDTLPAIAAMRDAPPSVRLVKNTLGRGAPNAIRAGFAAARGDVVVTSMADLSDPPEVILAMAEKIRAGADVVSGSRYMRGGSQTGGPWLKRTLSRLAGLSLRWLAGIGTHDPTSNFRAYSRRFLDKVSVESRAGFEIALELTVKAHLGGAKVDEVPSSWVDRSAGKSRFRLWRWMPNYLRWYARALFAPALVGLAWLAMLASAHHYVAANATAVPFSDEIRLLARIVDDAPLTPDWFWSQHIEHRLPLPRLVYVALMRLTGDHRSVMLAEVYLLAAVAGGMILAARKIRGRTSVADAFFVFLFLHRGHCGNLLSAFNIAMVLPAVLSSAILALASAGPAPPDRRTGSWIGLCLVALPLCGAIGVLQVPPIAAWIGLAGLSAWRSSEPSRRRAAPFLVAVAMAAIALVALYLRDDSVPRASAVHAGIGQTAGAALRFLAMSIGPSGEEFGLAAGLVILGLALSTAWLLFAAWRAHPSERWRIGSLLAWALAAAILALGIGWARGPKPGAGSALRYVTLASPFLALVYLAWCRYGTGAVGRLVCGSLCAAMGILAWPSTGPVTYAQDRLDATERLVRDAEAGHFPEELAERHAQAFLCDEDDFAVFMDRFRRLGLPPYREPSGVDEPDMRAARPFVYWKTRPIEARSDRPITRRKVGELDVALVHAPAEIILEIPPDARSARGVFGVDPLAYAKPERRTEGLRFSVGRGSDVLFERVLRPASEPSDGGLHAFDVGWPGATGGTLVLRVSNARGGSGEMDWGFWTEVELK